MAADQFFLPYRPILESTLVVPGAQILFTLSPGTNTKAAIYADEAMTTPLANPVVADGVGKFPPVYMSDAISYRVRVYSRTAVVGVDTPIEDYDPYLPGFGMDDLRDDLASTSPGNGAALITYIPATGLPAMNLQTALRLGLPLMPEHFGAAGDGSADDFLAFKALVAMVNSLGKAVIALSPGKTYKIDQYLLAGNGIAGTDLMFSQLTALTIHGNGAKIDIKGNFNRAVVGTTSLPGLYLQRCRNIVVSNLELDGNVDQMTRGAVSEGFYPTGVLIDTCDDFVFSNVNAHHFSTDGWSIRGKYSDGTNTKVCKRGILLNCKGDNNGRQGITPEGLRQASIVGGSFSWNGVTGGVYGTHAPAAGIQIEPQYTPATGSPFTRDQNTGDITIKGVRLEGNLGGPFHAGTLGVDTIIVDGNKMVANVDVSANEEIIFGSAGSKFINNDVQLYGNYAEFASNADNLVDMEVYGNTIRIRDGGVAFWQRYEVRRVKIHDNKVFVEGTNFSGKLWDISVNNVTLANNDFWIPAAAYVDGGAGDRHVVATANTQAYLFENNRFETDLAAAAGSSGTAHYAAGYSANAIVRGDNFKGTASGTADTFRPIFNGTFDTRKRYSQNNVLLGTATWDPPSIAAAAASSTTVTVTGAAFGDAFVPSFSIDIGNLIGSAVVSSANTVTVKLFNPTAGAIDLASLTATATKVS